MGRIKETVWLEPDLKGRMDENDPFTQRDIKDPPKELILGACEIVIP